MPGSGDNELPGREFGQGRRAVIAFLLAALTYETVERVFREWKPAQHWMVFLALLPVTVHAPPTHTVHTQTTDRHAPVHLLIIKVLLLLYPFDNQNSFKAR